MLIVDAEEDVMNSLIDVIHVIINKTAKQSEVLEIELRTLEIYLLLVI